MYTCSILFILVITVVNVFGVAMALVMPLKGSSCRTNIDKRVKSLSCDARIFTLASSSCNPDVIVKDLNARARFPMRTETAFLQDIRGNTVQRLLTAAWDLAVERITLNRAKVLDPFPTAVNTPSFEYIAYNFAAETQVMFGEVVTLIDLLSVLTSVHDQMDERFGFGTAHLNVYNGAAMVAHGAVKRS